MNHLFKCRCQDDICSCGVSSTDDMRAEIAALEGKCQGLEESCRAWENANSSLLAAIREGIAAANEQAAYISRLESAFQDAYFGQICHGARLYGIEYTEEVMQKKACEALEAIKRGD